MKEKDELMAYQLLIPHLVNGEALCRPAVPQWRKEFFFFSPSQSVLGLTGKENNTQFEEKLTILRNYTYVVRKERGRSLSNRDLRRVGD